MEKYWVDNVPCFARVKNGKEAYGWKEEVKPA